MTEEIKTAEVKEEKEKDVIEITKEGHLKVDINLMNKTDVIVYGLIHRGIIKSIDNFYKMIELQMLQQKKDAEKFTILNAKEKTKEFLHKIMRK